MGQLIVATSGYLEFKQRGDALICIFVEVATRKSEKFGMQSAGIVRTSDGAYKWLPSHARLTNALARLPINQETPVRLTYMGKAYDQAAEKEVHNWQVERLFVEELKALYKAKAPELDPTKCLPAAVNKSNGEGGSSVTDVDAELVDDMPF